jgi:hypothetical protein
MKKCKICKLEKPIQEFHVAKENRGGRKNSCKICENQDGRDYYLNNKHKSQEYHQKNRLKINAAKALYQKRRLLIDVNFKLKKNLSKRINDALHKNIKSLKTIELLGCSVMDFKNYFQSKFQDGMSWDNYGKWHIDHIRPCASFDLSDPKQQLECFNFKNLQPLWALDNIRKGDKF